ncbi:MAG: TIGR04076 family protein [Clostridiales bacterium]|nr:TIGR04076 family protein [Clostridiales bacterium]
MYKIKITAMMQTEYKELMEKFENPIEHTCDIRIGQTFFSFGERPEGFCESAWDSVAPFVKKLAHGEGNFFDGWMKNPYSAMISCNDGFRPVSFYLERVEENM